MGKIKEIINKIEPLDLELMNRAQKRLDNLTKPQGSLGRLEELAKLIVGITKKENPNLQNKVIFTLAGDHGVVEEGVSAYPKEVTAQMVYNFLRGGAGVNILAKHIGARVVVVDLGIAEEIKTQKHEFKNFVDKKINFGTRNMAKGPAMTKEEAVRSIEAGIEVIEQEINRNEVGVIGIGDMGIGNTTSSSAICSCITGSKVEDVTGRGTGINDKQLEEKIKTIAKVLQINRPDPKDPVDILAKVGGFEIGGLVGIILATAANRISLVIDGFITASAALIATEIAPLSKNYIFASHNSVERGHRIALNWMGMEPIFNLKMRLGEGTGACLGISIIEAGVKILTEMATFEDADVSREK